jgi:hypothetical protein
MEARVSDDSFPVFLPNIEAEEDLLGVRHVPDEFSQRERQFLDEGGRCEDLLPLKKNGLLVDVDYFQFVAARNVFLADPLQIGDRLDRLRCGSRDVKAENVSPLPMPAPAFSNFFVELFGFFCHPRDFSVICSVLQGQPAFYLKRSIAWADIQSDEDAQGVRHISDDLLDRLRKLSHQRGDGQDLVPCGKLGFSRRSITSIRYMPARCVSQIFSGWRRR